MENKMTNFLGIEKPYTEYNTARYAVLPVPFEHSTSYGSGTRQGPQAILKASAYVELYDEEFNREAYKKGIHTCVPPSLTDNVEEAFENMTRSVAGLLQDGKFPVVLGGEHSLSYPVFRAFNQHYENLSVLQFDAHSDLRFEYEDSIYSHASVMRRIYEINPNIAAVGIRSQCVEEARFIHAKNIPVFYAHRLHEEGFDDAIIGQLQENVYITFDVDYFDPSLIPATGTPEPGGFFWPETIRFLTRLFRKRNVVGFDVVELAPLNNMPHPDFTIAKLVYKLITLHDLTSGERQK